MTSTEEVRQFLQLPADVLLAVIEHLDLTDVLALRLACLKSLSLCQERSVWVKIVQEQQQVLPMPPELQRDDNHAFEHVETQDLIQLSLRSERVDRRWPTLRPNLDRWPAEEQKSTGTAPTILLGMQMVLDRWLLLVYGEGVVQLHDLQTAGSGRQVAQMQCNRAHGSQWSSFAAAIHPTHKILTVATSRCVPPYHLSIFTIDLTEPEIKISMNRQIPLESPKMLHAIDPALDLLALSASSKVQLMNISDRRGDVVVPAYPETHDDLWNGINAARFMGPYILVARTRTIELHHVFSALCPHGPRTPSLMHSFPMTTFKDVSFSDCKAGPNSLEMTMLVYDIIQGLYQYRIEVHNPAEDEVHPRLSVTQTGLYPLGLPLQASINLAPRSESDSSSSPTSPPETPTPTFSHTHFLQNIGHLAHGTSAVQSRGFLSTFAMGPQGHRAMWVERRRGGVAREIQVWSRRREGAAPPSAAWVYHFGADCEEMEKKVVYTINSFDLREDIICCAFSESRGIIALGNRLGNISVLPID
ncbi:hypothetical protein DFP72DRAFT_935827 [Ephemerocybe angulata]|uniref:F-box domain-containing protein n=1 Tax=Ephemerocybe angulata TaxID=980116 RepID=A0A8H6HAQ3_9AGAR|nr:hypothetical protein DFP72DRAFT_935827 [Tulosesus angulatus]